MKLRTILILLSLLTLVSASTGGYLYYTALRDAAFQEAERQATTRLKLLTRTLSALLSENIKPAKTLAGILEAKQFLLKPDENSYRRVNTILDHFTSTLEADVCYLMNAEGTTVASSNRDAPDSFVGQNFSFRPYFQQAVNGKPTTYLALGATSGKRGAYFSHPVYAPGHKTPVGIVVIKVSIDLIEKELFTQSDEILMVADPKGVIFISNRQALRFKSLWQMLPEEVSEIEASLQFGRGPWNWAGFQFTVSHTTDPAGNKYLMGQSALENYPGWRVVHLRNLNVISKSVSQTLLRIIGPAVLSLCLLIGLAVFFLYQRASHEIDQRKSAEKALRQSEERYRSIYHNAPAMLHSINPQGQLISVSDHWLKALGFTREEVIGKKLACFLTRDSGRYLEDTVIPKFFQTGFVNDIPYQFVKKDGNTIDALVSAIGERDEEGNVIRSLAVSIDVTERLKAEEALKITKEKLSLYSKDLERQVAKRTKEVADILKYTPAVVYLKDKEGRYRLINSRYEELFGIKNEDIQGKTSYDIFPEETADQFRRNDMEVLDFGQPIQAEEQVPQKDGIHAYLSIKFPVYDETGAINGVCGISMDITAVKKAQEQLRRFSVSIIESQEKERTAIARELHDELGQLLTVLRMDLVWMRERLQVTDAKGAERALAMCRLIDETIDDVRSLSVRLRPGVLDTLGLVDALEWIANDFEKRTGTACIFEHHQVPRLNDTLATAAYRIGQEALTNVTRHAQASHVELRIKTQNGNLLLSVTDNGRGFDTGILSETKTLGVAGMRERAGLVGGQLEVQSSPGTGTAVYFRVPVDQSSRRVN